MASPPAKYTAQIIAMMTPPSAERIERDALNREVSKSQSARECIELGVELREIATEYALDPVDLVNAARLHAIRSQRDDVTTVPA